MVVEVRLGEVEAAQVEAPAAFCATRFLVRRAVVVEVVVVVVEPGYEEEVDYYEGAAEERRCWQTGSPTPSYRLTHHHQMKY